MISLYDLAFEYVAISFTNRDPSKKEKQTAIDEISTLLGNGYSAKSISVALDKIKSDNTAITPGKTLIQIFQGLSVPKTNLLSPDMFYYHNELRIMPPPPTITIDYNLGTISKTIAENFLEMKASYSIDDLHNYYIKQMRVQPSNNFNGALQWLVKKYGIDITLFAIDIAANYFSSEDLPPPNNPFCIMEYVDKAKQTCNYKVTETKALGEDRIVPKRRILPSRMRSIDTNRV